MRFAALRKHSNAKEKIWNSQNPHHATPRKSSATSPPHLPAKVARCQAVYCVATLSSSSQCERKARKMASLNLSHVWNETSSSFSSKIQHSSNNFRCTHFSLEKWFLRRPARITSLRPILTALPNLQINHQHPIRLKGKLNGPMWLQEGLLSYAALRSRLEHDEKTKNSLT